MIFLIALALCGFVSSVNGATAGAEWCYHEASCNDTKWPDLFPSHCNGTRQSPIDIVTADAKADDALKAFSFTGYDKKDALKTITNTGRTIKVELASGVSISGGGLPDGYDSLQFHLHWGDGSSVPGSEHTVNGKRYPMELHIVNAKSSYHGNTTEAIEDSTGLAALGFFIDVMSGNDTQKPESWKSLTSYSEQIKDKGQKVSITASISLDDLLSGVDRTKYYRYLGSLTTPTCNEAVVWTVFKDPIKVSKDLVDLFSTTFHVNTSTSPLMVKTFRSIQPKQPVTTQANSASTARYSLGLILLSLALWKN